MGSCACSWTGGNTGGGGGRCPVTPRKTVAVLGLVLPVVVYWLGSRGSTSGGVPAAPPL